MNVSVVACLVSLAPLMVVVAACGSSNSGAGTATDVALRTQISLQSTVASGTQTAVAKAAPTRTPAPPPPPPTPLTTGAPPPVATSAVTVPAGPPTQVTIMPVVSVRAGTLATVIAQTSPQTSCSIVYYHPSGKKSTARGLNVHQADATGMVTWMFRIDASTKPGDGTVTATYNGISATALIHIM